MTELLAGVLAALLVAAPDGPAASAEAGPETVTRTGTVLLLPEALAARGIRADDGPIAEQAVLVAEDGAIVPLLEDPASRALFLDERLRDRRAEIRGWRHPGLPYLQVVTFRVETDDGTLRTPEYYCDVCTITVRYPQACPCCQGTMELRFRPESD